MANAENLGKAGAVILMAAVIAAVAAAQPSRVFGDVRKPVLESRVEPQCKWWKPHLAASTTLEVTIWKDGRVSARPRLHGKRHLLLITVSVEDIHDATGD